jgi:arginase family enzyme
VSFDFRPGEGEELVTRIDGVDAGFVAGMGSAEPGGPLARGALKHLRLTAAREGLCGMEFAEISQPDDVSDMTALVACRGEMDVRRTRASEGTLLSAWPLEQTE